MVLDGGTVRGHKIVSREWLERMATPCAIAPWYGRLVWLNRDGKQFPGASARAVVMQGAGDHYTWIDPELDAVVVLRWLDPAHTKATFARFGAALRG
jgi:CubicO group peptidase (beta-lactamase class C family)